MERGLVILFQLKIPTCEEERLVREGARLGREEGESSVRLGGVSGPAVMLWLGLLLLLLF